MKEEGHSDGREEIYNTTRGTVLHDRPEWATTTWQRAKGFMFSKPGSRAKIFLFLPSRSELIHMWFVFGPIDCIALDGSGTVIGMREALAPWRTWRTPVMSALLELPAGTIARSQTKIGDHIQLPKVTIPGWTRQS